MLRNGLNVLLLILLIANLWLAAAVAGKFGPEPMAGWLESPREPQRVTQQVRVERMQIQPPRATEAAIPAAPPLSVPRSEKPGGITQAAAQASADSCMEMGGFAAQNVPRAIEDLKAISASAPLPVEQFERTEQVRWWVHLPAQPSRENADRKLAELRRRKVTDVSVVTADDPESYTVSLGLFRDRERADKFLEVLRGQGVRTALISDAPRAVSRQWLRVVHADDAVRARMDEVRLRYGGDVLQDCKPVTQARREPSATKAEG
jgi:hypothetical protein